MMDFCYLLMTSAARTSILSILYPTADLIHDQETRLFASLPGKQHLDWLRGFGFPGFIRNDSQDSTSGNYSLSCVISDSKPLNVNLTGALMDNILAYLDTLKKDGFRTVAPHWIRNDTGMVGSLARMYPWTTSRGFLSTVSSRRPSGSRKSLTPIGRSVTRLRIRSLY